MSANTPVNHATNDVCFCQTCPICGRSLQIQVTLLGRRVYCQHCGGGFVAMDEAMRSTAPGSARSRAAVDAADDLLQRAALVLQQAGREPVRGGLSR